MDVTEGESKSHWAREARVREILFTHQSIISCNGRNIGQVQNTYQCTNTMNIYTMIQDYLVCMFCAETRLHMQLLFFV
jgi:hypothetical protein